MAVYVLHPHRSGCKPCSTLHLPVLYERCILSFGVPKRIAGLDLIKFLLQMPSRLRG